MSILVYHIRSCNEATTHGATADQCDGEVADGMAPSKQTDRAGNAAAANTRTRNHARKYQNGIAATLRERRTIPTKQGRGKINRCLSSLRPLNWSFPPRARFTSINWLQCQICPDAKAPFRSVANQTLSEMQIT